MSNGHLRDETIKKAAKRHRCYLCGEHIEAGEPYVKRTSANYGYLDIIKMHPECEAESSQWEWWEWEETRNGEMDRPKIDKG